MPEHYDEKRPQSIDNRKSKGRSVSRMQATEVENSLIHTKKQKIQRRGCIDGITAFGTNTTKITGKKKLIVHKP